MQKLRKSIDEIKPPLFTGGNSLLNRLGPIIKMELESLRWTNTVAVDSDVTLGVMRMFLDVI